VSQAPADVFVVRQRMHLGFVLKSSERLRVDNDVLVNHEGTSGIIRLVGRIKGLQALFRQ